MIPSKYLNQIKSVSGLKTLIAFLSKQNELATNQFEYPLAEIRQYTGLSINGVRNGVNELIEIGFLKSEERKGRKKSYQIITGGVNVPIVVGDSGGSREDYKLATGGRKKKEQTEEIKEDIDSIDFENMNLYQEDINSVTAFNKFQFMGKKEKNRIIDRIIKEVFIPMARPPIGKDDKAVVAFFAVQNRVLVTLLKTYRTEQIVAGIKYWTQVNPPTKGITSMHYLTFERKGLKNIQVALDYYKQQYVANAHIHQKDEMEKRQEEVLRKEQEEKEKLEQKKQEVANMTSDQFVANHLSRFKLNIKKD